MKKEIKKSGKSKKNKKTINICNIILALNKNMWKKILF